MMRKEYLGRASVMAKLHCWWWEETPNCLGGIDQLPTETFSAKVGCERFTLPAISQYVPKALLASSLSVKIPVHYVQGFLLLESQRPFKAAAGAVTVCRETPRVLSLSKWWHLSISYFVHWTCHDLGSCKPLGIWKIVEYVIVSILFSCKCREGYGTNVCYRFLASVGGLLT